MREIKFRGLNKDGIMVYGDLCTGFAGRKYIMPECYSAMSLYDADYKHTNEAAIGGWIYIAKSETIGQFTGLKDVNGVDVYEHDIVKFTTHDAIGFVKFENLCFMVETIDGNHYLQGHEVEIIGNIHQNPELLSDL